MMHTGPANGKARVVFISRSDGRLYANDEVNARKGSAAKQVGEALIEDASQLQDEETREEINRWKVVIGTGLADELAWPQGEFSTGHLDRKNSGSSLIRDGASPRPESPDSFSETRSLRLTTWLDFQYHIVFPDRFALRWHNPDSEWLLPPRHPPSDMHQLAASRAST